MADQQNIIRIDGIKWWVTDPGQGRVVTALCPDHHLRLTAIRHMAYSSLYRRQVKVGQDEAVHLQCAEGPHNIRLPRPYGEEKSYVIDRIDAKVFRGMKVLNLDDEAVPVAKEKVSSMDGKYFVTSQLMESKRGLQVVIYAGEKGRSSKAQIFVEPEVRRVAFDQKDLHPNDVFVKVEATFSDGSRHILERE